jgi:hypothetical protein
MGVRTIVATTEAGSTYVLAISAAGVRWYRVPGAPSVEGAATGWQRHLPRVVPGKRLLLSGTLRSTPVVNVAFVPEPTALTESAPHGYPMVGVRSDYIT